MSDFCYWHITSLLHSTLKQTQPHSIHDSQQADRVDRLLGQIDRGVLQEKLNQLDLSAVVTSLVHPTQGQGWTYPQANLAIARYLLFLFLSYLYPSQVLVPPQEVDLVWHEHLLQDTRKYTQDCEMLFNGFIHHARQSQLWENAVEENASAAYQQTRSLLDLYLQGVSRTSGDNLTLELLTQETPPQKQESSACGHPVQA
ncbi:hypothetical protein [Spirulina sp. 06S082]|uniref:hypothetical protein n=1 Tax=Spirulina sp. 06S082 TaxID=3110248 RepID=UPI002B20CB1A|nr:hypothetical protein [Spirulina sp. 06S082]MEA5472451.1 hypothetical protein [Spirulina sp. 06S082]